MIIFAIIVVLTLYTIQRAKQGHVREVRSLAGMDGIKEAIARSAEMGRPCFFTTGHGGGGLYTTNGPAHMAGISLLDFSARECARTGTKIVTCWPFPELVPIAQDVIEHAYVAAVGNADVPSDSVRFLSTYALAYKMGWMGQLYRERAGSVLTLGPVWPSDALQMTEPGVMIGALQVGGAPGMDTMSMLALTCDYIFIGEELYSAGAMASGDPVQLGTLFGSDVLKVGFIILVVAGFILTTMGIKIGTIFNL